MSDFQFDQETTASPASKRDGSAQRAQMHQFEGHLSSQWNIGDNPNGGYLLAIALRALLDAVPHPDPLSVTTQYLRPGLGGVAFELEIEVLRTGRSVSNARATLLQEGKPRVLVSAVCGDLSTGTGLPQTWSIPAPVIPAPDQCVQRSAAGQGVELPILGRLDTRLEPSCAVPGSSEHAELNGWIRFKDGRQPDSTALPMFCDAFPPSPFAVLGTIGWVPTLELTVHVRQRPAPGWIQGQFVNQDLNGGRMIESGCLWDSEGNLVAQSRQLGLVTPRD